MKHGLPKGAVAPLLAIESFTDLADDYFDGYRDLIDEFPGIMATVTPDGDLLVLLHGERAVEIKTSSEVRKGMQMVVPGPQRLDGFSERVKRYHVHKLKTGREVAWIEIKPGVWSARDRSAWLASTDDFTAGADDDYLVGGLDGVDWEKATMTIAGVAHQVRFALADEGKDGGHARRARLVGEAAKWMVVEAVDRRQRGEWPTRKDLISAAQKRVEFRAMSPGALDAARDKASGLQGWPVELSDGGRRPKEGK